MLDPDFTSHFVDRENSTFILVVEAFSVISQVCLRRAVLDQIFYVLLQLCHPDFLPIAVTMTEIVADDAILGVFTESFLSFGIDSVKGNHCECRLTVTIVLERCVG